MRTLWLLSLTALLALNGCEDGSSIDADDTTAVDTTLAMDTSGADVADTDSTGSDAQQDTEPLPAPVVVTDDGPVQGVRQEGLQVFWGIPFAKPPVGELRWALPELPEPWTDTLDASTRPPQCPQPETLGPPELDVSEDCLYLNVWAPDPLPENAPVMVWIHGGGFLTGSGAQSLWDGTHIVPEGVILVSINYRLGPLGFLGHPDLTDGNGNFGFIDQQLALAWVKANIDAFGGDLGNITLFGESAGAFSVCAHVAAPSSKGLFDKAIMQSGSCALRPLADAEADGANLAVALSCDSETDVVACMRAADADAIVAAMPAAEGFFFGGGATWSPALDGVRFTDDPNVLIASGAGSDVPVLMGTNADEGTLFLALANLELDETSYAATLNATFGDDAAAVLAEYPVSNFDDANAAMAAVVGDGIFVCPARRLARTFDSIGQSAWLYHFTRVTNWLFFPNLGAFHASELAFIFQIPFPGVTLTPEDKSLGAEMLGYWTRFAKTGDPNGDDAVTWDAYTTSADNHIELNVPVTTGTALKSDICDFWDGLAP